MQKYPRMFYAGGKAEICSLRQGYKFLFVILNEVKNLKPHTEKMCETRFFA